MKLINPLSHPHAGKAAILIAIAIALGITLHEIFFLVALLIGVLVDRGAVGVGRRRDVVERVRERQVDRVVRVVVAGESRDRGDGCRCTDRRRTNRRPA